MLGGNSLEQSAEIVPSMLSVGRNTFVSIGMDGLLDHKPLSAFLEERDKGRP